MYRTWSTSSVALILNFVVNIFPILTCDINILIMISPHFLIQPKTLEKAKRWLPLI